MGESTARCSPRILPIKMKTNKQVWDIVRRIPAGRVATYGQVAKLAETNPRTVGQLLHKNLDPENIPCHRVVDRDGKISENFAFGGWREQRKRLVDEGVAFIDATHVDLKRHKWNS